MFIHCLRFKFGHIWHRHSIKCIRIVQLWLLDEIRLCSIAVFTCDPSGKFVWKICLSAWCLQTFYSSNIATHSMEIKHIHLAFGSGVNKYFSVQAGLNWQFSLWIWHFGVKEDIFRGCITGWLPPVDTPSQQRVVLWVECYKTMRVLHSASLGISVC